MQTAANPAIPVAVSGMTPAPRRILMVVDGRYPATGGAEMQARLLSAAFSREGHSVRVLVPHLEPERPRRETIDGVPVHRLAYPRIKGFGAILLNLRFAAYLLRHQHEFDAIHIHMMHNLAGAAGWLRPWIRPTLTVKVSGAAEFQGGILDPSLRHKLVHRLLNAGAKRADAFQCISRYTLEMMRGAGYPAAKLHHVPNAVDCARFARRGETAGTLRVVFVGRHVAVKALDVLLQAWATVRRPAGAQLVLAGDGPERARLMTLAETLGLADSVEFPGLVHDVPALLATAAAYVQPSHQEGLPNAVLEAMAAGLPVAATRISGHEDIIVEGDTGLLVPPGDPAALAGALQRLLDDAALREHLGRRGAAYVATHFAIPVVLARLLELYARPHSPVRPA
ncbi:glycosyltransferase family 4 protein [Thiomonas sp.]|uniref:glycosyltransferase family 4 protein n=1 Tax=Thiomonas sp. TaxID=2047785 RepID=UPI00258FB6CA|nr:glycosyltransferase family 4 protein [Thiomonas sp.]